MGPAPQHCALWAGPPCRPGVAECRSTPRGSYPGGVVPCLEDSSGTAGGKRYSRPVSAVPQAARVGAATTGWSGCASRAWMKIGDRQGRPRANNAWDAEACPRFSGQRLQSTPIARRDPGASPRRLGEFLSSFGWGSRAERHIPERSVALRPRDSCRPPGEPPWVLCEAGSPDC
jgi:hypothetical protein